MSSIYQMRANSRLSMIAFEADYTLWQVAEGKRAWGSFATAIVE
jgi:hypothetical protein